jgi:hypothetical protein
MNASGAVSWAPTGGIVPPPGGGVFTQETRATFNEKIRLATKPNQTHWNEYSTSPVATGAGWPQRQSGSGQYTNLAGFVCYALVANALEDAGYSIEADDVLDSDYFFALYPEVTGNVQVGDIVLYEFNSPFPNPQWEHTGVITSVSSGNQSQFSVVSSLGVAQHFSYGAAQKRLGVFGTAPYGGEFTSWPWPQPYTIRIVRPQ